MGKIVVNKHFDASSAITSDKFQNKGEIAISNEVGEEGIYILNKVGNIVKIGTQEVEISDEIRQYIQELVDNATRSADHVTLSAEEYEILVASGSVVSSGATITYNPNAYYCVYENSTEESEEIEYEDVNVDDNGIMSLLNSVPDDEGYITLSNAVIDSDGYATLVTVKNSDDEIEVADNYIVMANSNVDSEGYITLSNINVDSENNLII